ncbi:MAG TPA: LytR C-terminal domain-containing protein [Gemmatimonadales bacterium]|nr:LytR C-terminal domain-containing protein [Gemmatimonadales bacterium]
MTRMVLVAVVCAACGPGGTRTPRIPGDRAPGITVEVLNASGRAGDARSGTRLLRREGIDVVYFGNADSGTLDSTRIIVRRGSAKVGQQVRAALGLGRVEIDLDSTKLLDVSVLLGADFAPPPGRSSLDFHP